MDDTSKIQGVSVMRCAQHAAGIAEMRKNIERLTRMHASLVEQVQKLVTESHEFQKRIERANLEILAAIGTIPDPINGCPGTGLRGFVHSLAQERRVMRSRPEVTGEYSRDDLILRTKEAESAAKASHTKMIVTLIGAFIGGIVSAVAAVLAALR